MLSHALGHRFTTHARGDDASVATMCLTAEQQADLDTQTIAQQQARIKELEAHVAAAAQQAPNLAPDPCEGPLDDPAVRRELEARQSGGRFLVGAHPAPASTRPLDDL